MVFSRADVLIPKNADMTKWSVVACDQYTSEPEYWQEVEKVSAGVPSAYNLILPEVYLEEPDIDERIAKINSQMARYVADGIFDTYKNCYIYVERTLKNGSVRKGLVGCLDLESYDYTQGSKSEVRATEKTVAERIPPRLKVRKDAPLELPHIMILLDDVKRSIIEPLGEQKADFKKLYDFDLMMDSGHIAGYLVSDDAAKQIEQKLVALENIDEFNARYDVNESSPLVFAMGDGNHSLATAKEHYNSIKNQLGEDKAKEHPSRYALAELVNLHDSSLEFEAIHRVVFGVDNSKFISELKALCVPDSPQRFKLVCDGKEETLCIKPSGNITVGSVQNFIDSYIAQNGGTVDYIHGDDVVYSLADKGNVGIILDAMDKSELFRTVIVDGSLPRKTFSMGEACDKRFYTEARAIR